MPLPPKNPVPGDFIVEPTFPGFKIIQRVGQKDRRDVGSEDNRPRALETARWLADEAGTRAWTYELDNQFLEIAPR